MARGSKLLLLVVWMGIAPATGALADVAVTDADGGCNIARFEGSNTGTHVAVQVWELGGMAPVYQQVFSTPGASFAIEANHASGYERGTPLQFIVFGTTGTLTWDGLPYFETYSVCDGYAKPAQSCVAGVAAGWAGVVAAQSRALRKCAANVYKGRDDGSCLTLGLGDKTHPLQKVRTKLAARFDAPACTDEPPPLLALPEGGVAIEAAHAASLEGVTEIFGGNPSSSFSPTYAESKRCVDQGLKQLTKLTDGYTRAFARAVKTQLKGTRDEIVENATDLRVGVVNAIESDAKWQKARAALVPALERACGEAFSIGAFGGCPAQDAGDIAACIDALIIDEVCPAAWAALNIAPSCVPLHP
jgi:hypothetical protein